MALSTLPLLWLLNGLNFGACFVVGKASPTTPVWSFNVLVLVCISGEVKTSFNTLTSVSGFYYYQRFVLELCKNSVWVLLEFFIALGSSLLKGSAAVSLAGVKFGLPTMFGREVEKYNVQFLRSQWFWYYGYCLMTAAIVVALVKTIMVQILTVVSFARVFLWPVGVPFFGGMFVAITAIVFCFCQWFLQKVFGLSAPKALQINPDFVSGWIVVKAIRE